MARIFLCVIINGVRRRREGTEGGLWPVLGGGAGGGGGGGGEKMLFFLENVVL